MEAKKHDILEQKLCKELEMIESKYMNNAGEMSIQDLEKIDKLYHALKSKATYEAMKEAENYGSGDGYSEKRGNSSSEYADGYSKGYSEAMNQMNGRGGISGPWNPTHRW